MNTDLELRKRRSFGDILTDPFKLIFRNIKAIFIFNLLYTFLPLVIGLGGIAYFQTKFIQGEGYNILIGIISLICLLISAVNVFASTYAIIKTADVEGVEGFNYHDIKGHFFNKYGKVIVFSLVCFLLFALIIGLIALSSMLSIALVVILMIFLFLVLFFYLSPLYYMAFNIYTYEEHMDLAEAFGKARDYLSEHWGSIFGIFIVSSIIYSTLNYTFAIPFTLIGLLFMDFTEIAQGQSDTFLVYNILQQTITAFFTSFLAQYIGIALFFKYFDLEEQQFGYNILKKIDQIGESTNQYFENEGEY